MRTSKSPLAHKTEIVDASALKEWLGIARAGGGLLERGGLRLTGGRTPAQGSGTAPELQRLVAALGTERVLVPRLAGGFPYGESPAPRRAAGGDRRPLSHQLQVEIGRIRQRALEEPTPANLRALGVAQLLEGDDGGAVDSLQQSIDLKARYPPDRDRPKASGEASAFSAGLQVA